MPTSATITDESPRLEIHVFGAGKGESILVRLPEGEWGLVDHYASRPCNPTSSPARSYLESRSVRQLEFVCLTHPHDDHYRGMGEILEHFSPRHLWLFPALDAKTAKRLVDYLGLAEADSCDPQGTADELVRILNWCNRRKFKAGPNGCRLKFVGLRKDLYPSPERQNCLVRICGIAPPDPLVSSYTSDLLGCFRGDGTLDHKLPHRKHNIISAALTLEWNRTRILLGGDVERAGWTLILDECPERLCSCSAVKVSHHGSTNGYSEGLWPKLGDHINTIAILTPFHNHRLPDSRALDHIGKHVSALYATGPLQQTAESSSVTDAPLESRQALRAELEAVPVSTSERFGRCSFVFDDQGSCLSREIIPLALLHEAV